MYLRGRRLLSTSLAAGLALVLAACGSQLSPETVAAVNGGGVGGVGGAVVGGDGVPVAGSDGGTLPGVDTGGDPLTAADGGSGTGGGTGTSGAGGTGGGASGAGGAGGGGAAGSGDNAADGGTKAGSCDGFKNQTGITDKEIVIANVSDISGPVPGIFASSQEAVRAYAQYFNATSDICGRKLRVLEIDTRTDTAGDQQGYAKACEEAFAAVGSMSAFDSGGAATAESCGLPDLRSAMVNNERHACATCYGTQSVRPNQFQNAVADFVNQKHKAAGQKAAYLWINVNAGSLNAQLQVKAMEKRGMNFVYTQGIDVSELDYSSYVRAMQNEGVRYVQFLGAYQQAVRLANTMRQQNFKPDLYVLDPTGYDPRYVEQGGSAVEGTHVFINIHPFEDMAANKELQLYNQWLQQVKPGAVPTFFGVFSWSAARLFVEQAIALGGRLDRKTLLDRIAKVDKWTGNGIHSPQYVGARRTGDCWRWIKLQGGKWVPASGTKYMCNGVTEVG